MDLDIIRETDLSKLVLASLPEQPTEVDFTTADEIFVKGVSVPKAGTILAQHSHVYDHTSAILLGSVRVWKDGEFLGDFKAPAFVFIEKGTKHAFLTLEDDTRIYCLHNASRPDVAAVLEEHGITVGL